MPPKGKLKEKCANCGNVIVNALTLNIPSYFLWSGVVYLATALVVVVMRPQAIQFLCDVWVGPDDCKTCGFDLVTCPKANCYRHAMNLTILTQANEAGDKFYEDYKKAVVEYHCLALVEKARDPISMGLMMYDRKNPDNPDVVSDFCIKFHCEVLWQSLTHSDLLNLANPTSPTGCSSNAITHHSGPDTCPCHTQTISSADRAKMYSMCGWPTTTTSTTVTTVTTPPGAAASRRLPSASGAPDDDRGCEGDADGECSRRREAPPTVADAVSDRKHFSPEETMQSLWDDRRLTHIKAVSPPPDSVNEDSPEFTVGEWGKCKCYLQCQSGLRSRPVSCLSSACKQPKPVEQEKCECSHCAACSVALSTLIFMTTCAAEGVLNLFVFLVILYMNSVQEEYLVKLSWLQCFLGFTVKQIPPLVRLIVLVNMGQAIFMLFQVWIPTSLIEFEPVCNDVPQLKVLSIFLTSIMMFQILLGVLAKHFNRMYPYLFKPMRASKFPPLRWIGKIQRALGP